MPMRAVTVHVFIIHHFISFSALLILLFNFNKIIIKAVALVKQETKLLRAISMFKVKIRSKKTGIDLIFEKRRK